MVGRLLFRGMMVGLIASFLAFGFAKLFGEPQIDRAIQFEAEIGQAKGEFPEPELVTRSVQSTLGLLTGLVVYGTAFGGIFALVFAYMSGRVGRIDARGLAAILALAGFVAIVVAPALKYPASPPSVGHPETIKYRTEMFFLMIATSTTAMALAATTGRQLAGRYGVWSATVSAAAIFIVIIATAQRLLPDINEVPEQFPAVVLWRFRMAAFGMQLVMWTALGLIFGWLTDRSLRNRISL